MDLMIGPQRTIHFVLAGAQLERCLAGQQRRLGCHPHERELERPGFEMRHPVAVKKAHSLDLALHRA